MTLRELRPSDAKFAQQTRRESAATVLCAHCLLTADGGDVPRPWLGGGAAGRGLCFALLCCSARSLIAPAHAVLCSRLVSPHFAFEKSPKAPFPRDVIARCIPSPLEPATLRGLRSQPAAEQRVLLPLRAKQGAPRALRTGVKTLRHSCSIARTRRQQRLPVGLTSPKQFWQVVHNHSHEHVAFYQRSTWSRGIETLLTARAASIDCAHTRVWHTPPAPPTRCTHFQIANMGRLQTKQRKGEKNNNTYLGFRFQRVFLILVHERLDRLLLVVL